MNHMDSAVSIDGRELPLGFQATAAGMEISFAMQLYVDGGRWLHSGLFSVPTATITTQAFIIQVGRNSLVWSAFQIDVLVSFSHTSTQLRSVC